MTDQFTTDAEALAYYHEHLAGKDGWPEVPDIYKITRYEGTHGETELYQITKDALITRIQRHAMGHMAWFIDYGGCPEGEGPWSVNNSIHAPHRTTGMGQGDHQGGQGMNEWRDVNEPEPTRAAKDQASHILDMIDKLYNSVMERRRLLGLIADYATKHADKLRMTNDD